MSRNHFNRQYNNLGKQTDTIQNEGAVFPTINGVTNYTDSNGIYHKDIGCVDISTLTISQVYGNCFMIRRSYIPNFPSSSYAPVNCTSTRFTLNNIDFGSISDMQMSSRGGLSAGAKGYTTIDVSKSGYTPIMATPGVSRIGILGASLNLTTVISSDTVYLGYYTPIDLDSANSTVTVKVLYQKDL